jgi:transposase
MVRLSEAGWSVPRIARHLGQHEQTVRTWIKAFRDGAFEARPNKPRGGKEAALTAPRLERVRAAVATGTRTWTAAQLADWGTAHHGVRLSADRVRIHLRRARLSWPRSSRTLQPCSTNRTPTKSRSARPCGRSAQQRGRWFERLVPSGRSGLCPAVADDL